jgi:hypothetical protein
MTVSRTSDIHLRSGQSARLEKRRQRRAEWKALQADLTFSFLGRDIGWSERVDSSEKRKKRKRRGNWVAWVYDWTGKRGKLVPWILGTLEVS